MQHATQTTDDPTAFGIVLSLLGGALAEGQDEAETLRELAEVVSRQRLRPAALADLTPVVAAFLARVVIEPHLDDTPFPPEADELMRSAHALVTTALETGGGARAWRQLPGIALAIAQYATRRGLSIPALAEALPRLAARFGGGPREATPAERQQPRGGFSRAAASDALRRMHISGPVEIVILDR
jgi:hypothetical protein